ncbi:hypothetical protein Maeo_0947 [Methanococcus aeolicus Nankai-3]|uniref:DUF86 domain-containing protein n=1 Tax=Methanococcus aeolicus (strain ATCC BAA-1280 / DSM 17508 / OCM 812 / Nankai-3) TaxID=419665 RepID=A6UVK4_META3|nr:HepT-like ribonuclease domain-containing protein [Methanococcus aeolicus]ABR56526.1 hypothetical protein Maeo_0947 [Methanococcus aeolicus Nankai-3]
MEKIIGFRNILIHKYFGVDYETTWFIIKEELPKLKQTVEKILKELDNDIFFGAPNIQQLKTFKKDSVVYDV